MSRSSRRAFLGTLGAAAAVLPDLGSTTIRMGADLSAAAPAAGQAAASYDLLIKGGGDESFAKLSGSAIFAITNGKIAAVAVHRPTSCASVRCCGNMTR